MSPDRIAREGRLKGLDIMALTDHNSCLNTPPFLHHCREQGILGLAGAEVTTSEEVHILTLFPDADTALSFGELLWNALPDFRHDPDRNGDQVQVDRDNTITGMPDRYLVTATTLSLSEITVAAHERGGLVIPAHIDRPWFGLIAQLGFIPDDPYDALEITQYPVPEGASGLALTTASDAHYPEQIGRRYTLVEMEELSFTGLKEALHQKKTTLFFQTAP